MFHGMSIKDKKNTKDNFSVKIIPSQETWEWLLKKHYAHRIPSISYAFGLYEDKKLIGVCTFGTPASDNISKLIPDYNTIELNRLVVTDMDEKNITSFFVSKCLKLLPTPISIISYADTGQGHIGKIYQATNWIYTGKGQADHEFIKNGNTYHRRHVYEKLPEHTKECAIKHGYTVKKTYAKYRYFMFLGSKKEKKEMTKRLPFKIQPYPKGETKRYDASYQPITQGLLF